MDGHFDSFWTGVWGGLIGGLCFVTVAAFVLHDKYREKQDMLYAALAQEIQLLQNIRWNYQAAKRTVSSEGVEVAKTLMKKKRIELTDDQAKIVDHYLSSVASTGQTHELESSSY